MEQRNEVGLEEEEESSTSENTLEEEEESSKSETTLEEEEESSKSENTGVDGRVESEVATLDDSGVADSTSADEKITSESTSTVEKDVSESAAQEEEEEECGFCLFMKQGPCGERFKLWQGCVEGAEKEEKDIVEQCAQVTSLLKVCMEMNPQYYGPVLEAEKAMEADLAPAEKTSSDGAQFSEFPAGGEESAESENREHSIETTEVSVDVVDGVLEAEKVMEADLAPAEKTSNDGPQFSESPAGGEESAESENREHSIETTEVSVDVVDGEGQVVEAANVLEVEVKAI